MQDLLTTQNLKDIKDLMRCISMGPINQDKLPSLKMDCLTHPGKPRTLVTVSTSLLEVLKQPQKYMQMFFPPWVSWFCEMLAT